MKLYIFLLVFMMSVKYIIWEEMFMFDKFEYYSIKNDSKKQHKYMLKIHNLIATKIKLKSNKNL